MTRKNSHPTPVPLPPNDPPRDEDQPVVVTPTLLLLGVLATLLGLAAGLFMSAKTFID